MPYSDCKQSSGMTTKSVTPLRHDKKGRPDLKKFTTKRIAIIKRKKLLKG